MQQFLFDLDGTLTKVETLPIIAREFGIDSEIETLTRQTIEGQISFAESFSRRVELLKKIPVSEIANLLEKIPIHEKLVRFIQENSDRCSIVTGNLDVWIDKLCERIGCEFFSSIARVSKDQIVEIEEILRKDSIVKNFQSQKKFVIYIGDGANDFEAMKSADISIASGILHRPAECLKSAADFFVETEDELLNILRMKKIPRDRD